MDAKQIIKLLRADNDGSYVSKGVLRGIRCPSCGHDEASVYVKNPLAIFCPRKNNCLAAKTIGYTPTKDIYPELFKNLTERYPTTKDDPRATARAYLRSRGLDDNRFGYSQSTWHESRDNKVYQTVCFDISDNAKQHILIDYGGSKGNKRILGTVKNKVYESIDQSDGKDVFIVEGILDALSLRQIGKSAIAIMSCNFLPIEFYLSRKDSGVTYLLGLDHDHAGLGGIKKHVEFFRSEGIPYQIALPPKGSDWNDLLVANRLSDKTINACLKRGHLHGANDEHEYFRIYVEQNPGTVQQVFIFNNQTYLGSVKKNEYSVRLLMDCSFEFLYLLGVESESSDRILYMYFNLVSAAGRSYSGRMFRDDFNDVRRIKSVLSAFDGRFCGNHHDLDLLLDYYKKEFYMPVIESIDKIGYYNNLFAYVFPNFAYNQMSRRIEKNDFGYLNGIEALVQPNDDDCIIDTYRNLGLAELERFTNNISCSFGYNGLLAFGFYIASSFRHLVLDQYNLYPFLSIFGDPSAGKSSLTKLLNRCFFVDSEGKTLSGASTMKGDLRSLARKSSMVTALLEGKSGSLKFDFNQLLTFYNGNVLYHGAMKTQDQSTFSIRSGSALVFVWNREPFESQAIKERVISLEFNRPNKVDTSVYFRSLMALDLSDLAGIGHFVLSHRRVFEKELIGSIKDYIDRFQKMCNHKIDDRLLINHAIPLGALSVFLRKIGYETLLDIKPYDNQTLIDHTLNLCYEKRSTAIDDLDLADEFLGLINRLGANSGYKIKDDRLYIYLPDVLKSLKELGYDSYSSTKRELINQLKSHSRFVGYLATRIFDGGQVAKVYVFNC